MKTINVTITIQMDVKDQNDTAEIKDVLESIDNIIGQSELESDPKILIPEDPFLLSNVQLEEEEVFISRVDVELIAKQLNIKLIEGQIRKVQNMYPSELRNDPTATWNLVVEHCIQSLINQEADEYEYHKKVNTWIKKNAPAQYHNNSLDEIPTEVFNDEQIKEYNELMSRI